jgi:uncharacterized lipoprotein YmbA
VQNGRYGGEVLLSAEWALRKRSSVKCRMGATEEKFCKVQNGRYGGEVLLSAEWAIRRRSSVKCRMGATEEKFC